MVATTDVQLFANNRSATLNSDVAVPDTSLVLSTGQGAAFPSPGAGQFFAITIQNTSSGAVEVCYCTARTGDILSVQRAQEGTTALAFASTVAVVQMRLTKGTLEKLIQRRFTGADVGKYLQIEATGEIIAAVGVGGVSASAAEVITGTWRFEPRIRINEPAAPVDNRLVEFIHDGGGVYARFLTDAGVPGTNWLFVDRANEEPINLELRATVIGFVATGGFTVTGPVTIYDWLELGHASDTTFARAAAGEVDLEGNRIWHQSNIGGRITALTEDSAPDVSADYVITYDNSAGAARKVKLSNLVIGLGGSLGSLSAEILADSPVGYWKLDEASGNFADSSGNGRTMTATTASFAPLYQYGAWAPRETTKYVYFPVSGSGGTRSDTCGLSVPVTGDWTFECIVVITQTSSVNGFFGIGGTSEAETNNYQVRARTVASTGVLGAYWENGAGTDNNVNGAVAKLLVAGVPQHVAWVKDGTANTVSLYINGILIDVVSYSTEPTGGSAATSQVGANDVSGTTNGPIGMAHAALYSTALSTARVRAHAQAAGFLPAV